MKCFEHKKTRRLHIDLETLIHLIAPLQVHFTAVIIILFWQIFSRHKFHFRIFTHALYIGPLYFFNYVCKQCLGTVAIYIVFDNTMSNTRTANHNIEFLQIKNILFIH